MKIGSKKQKKDEKNEVVDEVKLIDDPKPVEPETTKEVAEERDLLDMLLDKDNKENIVLYDGEGKRVEFEQIAVIPLDKEGEERKLYVILKPIDGIEGMADDEAIVFLCGFDEDGETRLTVEESDEVANQVFEKYYELLKDEE